MNILEMPTRALLYRYKEISTDMSKHYENQKRIGGKFVTENPKAAKAKLTVRVTDSLRDDVELAAKGKVADWLREAIIEKLNKELENA